MTDPALTPPPIACSLAARDFQARLAWIAALNARSLRSHRRDDLVLRLIYTPDAADAVREMVTGEQACCAFLKFVTRLDQVGFHLTITAPEAAREAADLVFAPFVAKAPAKAASSCDCCGGAAA